MDTFAFTAVPVSKQAWSLAEVEIMTGISRATLYRLLNTGQLATVKIGGRRLVPGAEMQRLLTPETVEEIGTC